MDKKKNTAKLRGFSFINKTNFYLKFPSHFFQGPLPLKLPVQILCTMVVLLILVIDSAQSTPLENQRPVCRALKADLPFVGERALSVVLPDGREIVVIGHIHGERQAHFFTEIYRQLALTETPGTNLLNWLNGLYAEVASPLTGAGYLDVAESETPAQKLIAGRSTLNHQKENLKYLLSALQTPQTYNPIEFIGVEATQDTLAPLTKYYLFEVARLEKAYAKHAKALEPEIAASRFEDLILASSQVEFYLLHRHPNLLTSIPLLGTVPPPSSKNLSLKDYRQETKDLFNLFITQWTYHHQRDPFTALFHQEDELDRTESFKNLLQFLNDVKFQSIHTPEEFQQRVAELDPIHPTLKGPILYQLLENMEKLFMADYEKNTGVAKALVAENKSGIQFIGIAHLFAVASALESECQKLLVQDKASQPLQ